uniref:Uncharacterized protein n=1 Tax=Timema genevievae TaxID=629358 RepID=A0A7R9K3J6_TIMGE|nr:unnamed protein product [Timema genevievae]
MSEAAIVFERAELVFLRYSHRWAKEFVRKRLELVLDGGPHRTAPPRHCCTSQCPCQFIEDHLKYKPRGKSSIRQFFRMPDFGLNSDAQASGGACGHFLVQSGDYPPQCLSIEAPCGKCL